jgi:hypothetical protein
MEQLMKKCVSTVRANSEASIVCYIANDAVDLEFCGTDDDIETIINTLVNYWCERTSMKSAGPIDDAALEKIIRDVLDELDGDDEGEDDNYVTV